MLRLLFARDSAVALFSSRARPPLHTFWKVLQPGGVHVSEGRVRAAGRDRDPCDGGCAPRYKYELCPFHNVTQHEQTFRWNAYSGILG